MSEDARYARKRWTIAWLGSLSVGILVLALFRRPMPAERGWSTPVAASNQATLGFRRVAPSDAALVDPSPLFLPTDWNTAQKTVVLPEFGGAFIDYRPKYSYEESEFRGFQPQGSADDHLLEVISIAPPGPPMLGLGRADLSPPVLPLRGAFLEVSNSQQGQRVLAMALPEASFPISGEWGPIEFIAVVDASGLVGPMVPVMRSGAEEVDGYFQEYLVQKVKIGMRIAPGIYTIRVGP